MSDLILVLGTPCGGTRYTASRLREAGYDVGHESHCKPDGGVCGFHAFFPRDHLTRTFARTYRLFRHPLLVLETLPSFAQSRSSAGVPWAGEPDKHRAALLWWVLLHERYAHLPVIRLGNEDDWAALLADLATVQPPGEPLEPAPDPISKRSRERKRWTWETLHEAYPDLAARALAVCKSVGVVDRPEHVLRLPVGVTERDPLPPAQDCPTCGRRMPRGWTPPTEKTTKR